jgi:hypothetical protein
MSLRDRLSEGAKKMVTSGPVLRFLSDDRVMRLTTGVMDARTRLETARGLAKEALLVLRDGQGMPSIDPALAYSDDDIKVASNGATNGHAAKSNGHAANGTTHTVSGGESAAAPSAPKPQPIGPRNTDEAELAASMAERASLAKVGGKDVFDKCFKFMTADNARAMGVYPFFRPLDFNNGPEAQLEGRTVTMLGSNNYLGLTAPPRRQRSTSTARA